MSTPSTSDEVVPASVEGVVRSETRLAALRRYDVLDTEPEPAFDRIAKLAAHLFSAPTALVNFVDADRQWFKSTVGQEEIGDPEQNETGLGVSFCVYTVEKGDLLIVEDLSEDERFADNPYVTEHGARFYAGAPLVTPDDRRIGTLCVLDTEPRSPSEETVDRLADLAAMVVDELELRRERTEHQQSRELLRQSQRLADVGGSVYDPETDDVTWTDQTYRIFGLSPGTEVDLGTAVDFYTPESRSVIEPAVERLLDEGGQYDLELDVVTADGERRHVRTIAEAQRENDETTQIVGAIQDVTEQHRDRRRKEYQTRIFEWIATGAPIDAVLDEIARFTEEELPDAVVSILQLDDNQLYHASGPSLPEEYIDAIDGVEIGPDVGTCGAAAHHGREVITEDIQEDDRWEDYRTVAEQADFRSCSSQVIQGSDGEILGTFAIYRAEPGRLESNERQLVKRMSHVASVALEREQRERVLRESEERWQRLVDRHPGPIHISIDGQYAYANEAAAELLGVDSAEDLIGQEMADFISPEERDRLWDRGEKVYEKREEADLIETRLQRPDGTERIVLVRSVPIQYNGEDAAQTMMQDVTERREAQRELREQKEMLQTLFNNVPVMITLLKDEEIEMINKHVGEVLGWSEEALDGPEDLLERCYPDPETRQRVLDNIVEAPDEWRDHRPKSRDDDRVDTTWKNVHLPDGRTLGIGVDISERKARERELRETNQRLRLALEAADAGTFEFEMQTEQVRLDERAINLFGLAADSPEWEASLFEEIILDDDFERLVDVFHRTAEEERTHYEASYRIRRPDDGEVRHIHTRGLTLRDEGGEPERVIGISQDITERKEREKQLRLLEAAVEHSPATVLITEAGPLEEPGPKTVYANPAVEKITGYGRDEVIGQSPRMLQGPDTDRAALDRIRTALENDEPVREVVRNYTKEGAPYWNELFISPVRDEEGTVTHYVSIQQDVTERRRRKEALERQNDLFAKAQDIADVGAWEYDVQAETLNWTEQTYRIHRLASDIDLTPERGIRFYHPDDRSKIRESFERAVEEGESYDLELRLITDDGEQRWVRTRGEPQAHDGQIIRLRGTIQDITERKRAEEELRRSEELHRTTLSSITDTVFLTKEDGTLTYVCPNVDYIFDYSEEEARALGNIRALLGGDPGSAHNFEDDGRLKNVECRIESAHGKQRDLLVNVRRVSIQGATRMYTCRDVTERKKAEIALRQSRERYRSLFRDSTDAILVHDLNGTIQEVNPKAESLFGYGMEEMEGQSLGDLHAPSETETARQKLETLQQGTDFEAVSRYVRADDSIFWGEVVANTVDIDGKTVARTLIRDVTEREESRRALERYRDYTSRIINAIDDLFFALDEEARFQRWNDRIPEVTGYSDAELRELTAFDLVPETEHERVRARISEALMEGRAQIEVPLLRKDGTTIPYEFAGSLVETPEGEVQIVGIGRDIAERRRRKRELERQNDLFSMAQSMARVGAGEYNVQTGENMVTDEVKRIHGLSADDELTPERSISFYHPDDRATIREAFTRAVEEAESYDLELRIITDDGEQRWVHTQGRPQYEDGELVRIRGATQDVTDRVRRREELKAAKETAEEADRIKSALLSNMNHEFRTPLTSIISFSEILTKEPAMAEKFANRILGGGKRLLHTLNTVMDFAELEADSVSPTPTNVDLGNLARSVVNAFSHQIERDEVSVQVREPDGAVAAFLDEHLVERVLAHLLSNAVKFTGEGGAVSVTLSSRSDVVTLLVSDTGDGIDPEFLPRVYDQFAQASSGHDRTHDGNGLGLTIAKRMVDRMDGTIDVDSTQGEGTTVTVRLPVLKQPEDSGSSIVIPS